MKNIVTFVCLLGAATAEICSQVIPSRRISASLNCNIQGSLSKPANLGKPTTIKPIDARSQDACRDACLENRSDCISYSYSKRTGVCQQYAKLLVKQGIENGKTGTHFWNHRCWAQNFTTGNDLQNLGFETGGHSLSPFFRDSQNDNFLPVQVKPGSNSSTYSALLRVGTRIGSNRTSITMPFTICPNTSYYFQPTYRFLGKPGQSRSFLGFSLNAEGEYFSELCSDSSHDGVIPGDASSTWTTLLSGGNGWILVEATNTTAQVSMEFSATFGDFYYGAGSGAMNPMPNPVLDEYQVDFNTVKLRRVLPTKYGPISCPFGIRSPYSF